MRYGPTLPGLALNRLAPTWQFSIVRRSRQILDYRAAPRSSVPRCRPNSPSSAFARLLGLAEHSPVGAGTSSSHVELLFLTHSQTRLHGSQVRLIRGSTPHMRGL